MEALRHSAAPPRKNYVPDGRSRQAHQRLAPKATAAAAGLLSSVSLLAEHDPTKVRNWRQSLYVCSLDEPARRHALSVVLTGPPLQCDGVASPQGAPGLHLQQRPIGGPGGWYMEYLSLYASCLNLAELSQKIEQGTDGQDAALADLKNMGATPASFKTFSAAFRQVVQGQWDNSAEASMQRQANRNMDDERGEGGRKRAKVPLLPCPSPPPASPEHPQPPVRPKNTHTSFLPPPHHQWYAVHQDQ